MPDLVLGISAGLSLLATAGLVAVWRLTEPGRVLRVEGLVEQLRQRLEDVVQVELPRVTAGSQVMLDRAEDMLEAAETKRRRAAGRASAEKRKEAAESNGGDLDWTDPTMPESARRAALAAAFRNR